MTGRKVASTKHRDFFAQGKKIGNPLDICRVFVHNSPHLSRVIGQMAPNKNGVSLMKSIFTLAGCAAALFLAGCASTDIDPNAPAEQPNLVRVYAMDYEPVLTTQLLDGSSYIGKSYAELNRLLGAPKLSGARAANAASPNFAAFSETKRLDIVGEVFYRKLGSATVMETQSPRFYENIRVVKAFFDDKGIATNAVVTKVDRLRTPCQVCFEINPCPIHGCDATCNCPAPCGCETCAKANKEKCYEMGCVPGEPCKCCCDGKCAKAAE